jgi:hypothetical protein
MLGYVTPEQLASALKQQACELVYELIRWGSGKFRFHPFAAITEELDGQIHLNLAPEMLLMEGFRRIDEWRLMENTIGHFDSILFPMPTLLSSLSTAQLEAGEQDVIKLIDGQRSVNQIVKDSTRAPFDTLKIIYRLISLKLVAVNNPGLSATSSSQT